MPTVRESATSLIFCLQSLAKGRNIVIKIICIRIIFSCKIAVMCPWPSYILGPCINMVNFSRTPMQLDPCFDIW